MDNVWIMDNLWCQYAIYIHCGVKSRDDLKLTHLFGGGCDGVKPPSNLWFDHFKIGHDLV